MQRSLAVLVVAAFAGTAAVVASSCKPRGLSAAGGSTLASAEGASEEFPIVNVPKTAEECMERTLEGRPINMLPEPQDYYIDAVCSELFMRKFDPQKNGVISLFGSSSLKPTHVSYHAVKDLAAQWTAAQKAKGRQMIDVPFLTATGPGVMEAANCGVNGIPAELTDDAKKQHRAELQATRDQAVPSLGYGTTFGVPDVLKGKPSPNNGKPYESGSKLWEINDCTTHGYIFRSFRMRESEMIDRARISIVAPGGVGTEWEIFEILSKIQTGKAPNNGGKKPPLVLFFYGNDFDENATPSAELARVAGPDYAQTFAAQKKVIDGYWSSLFARMNAMLAAGTIKKHDLGIPKCAHTTAEAIALMQADLYGTPAPAGAGRCEGLNVE